jgi:hypothetical protein
MEAAQFQWIATFQDLTPRSVIGLLIGVRGNFSSLAAMEAAQFQWIATFQDLTPR